MSNRTRLLPVFLLAVWNAPPALADDAGAASAAAPTNSRQLGRLIEPLIAGHRGEVAVAIKHLATGEYFEYQGDKPMPTASLIKFPVMIEAYRQADTGRVDLDDEIVLEEGDKVPGSGVLTPHFSPGVKLSLRDAIRLMIAYSDNTATNLVLDRIGLKAVGDTMTKLGCPQTRIHAKVFRRDTSIDPDRSREFGLGSTTARETLRLYQQLHAQALVNRAASQAMLKHLRACQDDTKLAADLKSGVRIAHKGGAV
ncbi:MAG: serine hydrolase, partial [Pirellulaceae bacterium]|nr:serine hydrolase [Pirellulaceae bacterium]